MSAARWLLFLFALWVLLMIAPRIEPRVFNWQPIAAAEKVATL